MLFLELLEHIQLLLLVAGRLSHLLLALIEHHLLDHRTGFTVEVTELRVLGRDLGGIDLGVVRKHVRPPLHRVDLLEVDFDELLVFEGPGGFVDADRIG